LRPRDQRPYDDRQYNEEADVTPSLSSFSPRDAARQWRNYTFVEGR
jgi:hypothetical protein